MRHPNTHRFLIVRLGSLGDVVHGMPVAAALRERYPEARIDWMVDPRYVEPLGLLKGLDAAIPVNPRRSPRVLMATLRGLRGVRYTAAIDLQGLIKSAVLARLAGAWQTIGLTSPHLREPLARRFYTDVVDPGPRVHVIEKGLALLEPLGVRTPRIVFPLVSTNGEVQQEARRLAGGDGYLLLNPGAAWPNKRWPAERFGALAARLREVTGLRSLVLWGPGEEADAAAVVATASGAASLAPRTRIVDLFTLARGARLVVSGDTGPLHVAAAVSAPVVALFGPTIAERNGPWSADDVVVSRTVNCSCLYRRTCRTGSPCIEEITVDEVVAAARARLATASQRRSGG